MQPLQEDLLLPAVNKQAYIAQKKQIPPENSGGLH
jgi:hypothetical protein